jgi:hypothetical protein
MIFSFNISSLEWEKKYFKQVWPKWMDGIHKDLKDHIKNIGM